MDTERAVHPEVVRLAKESREHTDRTLQPRAHCAAKDACAARRSLRARMRRGTLPPLTLR